MNLFIEKALAVTGGTGTTLPNPLSPSSDIYDLLNRILGYIFYIITPIAIGMILWGAFQILFSAGDPKKATVGRQTILYTVIGYIIIISSGGIILVIQEILGASN